MVDQYILNKYGIDSLQFAIVLIITQNPKEYAYIFEVIQTNLSRLEIVSKNEVNMVLIVIKVFLMKGLLVNIRNQ